MEIFRLFGSILVDNDEANRSISDTNDKAEGVGVTFLDGIKKAAQWGAGIATAAGTAALAVGTLAVNVSEDLQKALNGLQASTGTGAEKMGGMRDAMLDIYNNNFGDSFEDIGASMQTIAQQTKLSGDALSSTTQNALAMRDTFGIEVTESIRSVNQLMKNFGIDSDSAYNLMAQGAQNGLNANENLADSINEYSVHFQQIGLGAEEMFNMMANGAASGVFDIDKLGDAIKEFGIRSKDMSTGTIEAFTALGLNANQISADFAAGGEAGKKAFEEVTTRLTELDEPLKQTAVGVALFGTMYEDIGVKGIDALTTLKGGIDTNINALQQINAVKYNTFGEAMTGIKRQLETGILLPLGEKILPKLNEFATWIQANMPKIINKFKEVAEQVVKFKDDTVALLDALTPLFAGIAAGALTFGIYTLAINASAIATGIWTTVTGVATVAGTAFSAVLAFITSPIGLVVIAIGALVAAGVLLYKNWDLVKEKASEAWTYILEKLTPVIEGIKSAFGAVKTFVLGVWDGIWWGIKGYINLIISGVNLMINGLNKLHFSAPDWVPGMGGKSWGINIPKIPQLAKGGNIGDDGAVMVGEKGPEILSNIKGARVTPLDKTGGININITGNTIMSDDDADKFGELIVRRLKALGVT
jgi:phage-related minor tail protein